MKTYGETTYVSLTIEPGAEQIELSDVIVGVLAQAINRPPQVVRKQLESGPITLFKVRANRDLRVLVKALKKGGLQVRIRPYEGDKGARSPSPVPDKTVRTALSLPSSAADMDLNWEKGQIIEGIYEVLGSAAGGMGRVYFVFHRLWKMNMAIKTPHRAAVKSETRMLRFLREAELWVNLGLHPNIATCYYARVIQGIPRLFIEFVDGGNLELWKQQGRLDDLRTLADLMLQFCHGMMYAESRGMIHRDIKPANCLITRDKILKITDFGLVKRVDDAGRETRPDDWISDTSQRTDTSVTLFEQGVMGSPWYMAPERILEKSKDDIRSDIYSFGVMLYELAVGAKPFAFPKGFSLPDLLRSHLRKRPVPPLSVRPDIPLKLVEIMLACLDKKPENRYPSFAELCPALESACSEVAPDRKPRPRPNLVGLKANSLNNQAVSLLDLGQEEEAIRLLEDAHSANTEHLEAVYNLHTLRWIRGEISDREVISRMESLKIEVRETADYYHLMGLICLQTGDASRGMMLLEKACKIADHYRQRWKEFRDGPRGFVRSLALISIAEQGSFAGHIKSVRCAGFAAGSQRTLSVGEDRSIRVWDLESGRCVKNLRTFAFVPVAGAFSVDGTLAATAYGDAFKTLDVWDLGRGELLRRHQGMGVFGVTFSPDSRYMAAFGTSGQIWVLDSARQEIVWRLNHLSAGISCAAFVGNSEMLVLGEQDGMLTLLRLHDPNPVLRVPGHTERVTCVDISADGKMMVTGGADEIVRLWDVPSGREMLRFHGHRRNLVAVRFMPDGSHVVSASSDGAVKVWDRSTARCYRTISGLDEDLTACSISSDGRRLLMGGARGSLLAWSMDTGWFKKDFLEPAICRPRTFKEMTLIYDSFNSSVAEFKQLWDSGDRSNALRIFDRIRSLPGFCWSKEAILIRNLLQKTAKKGELRSWSFIRSFHGHSDTVGTLKAGQDGLTLLTGSLDGAAALWDVVSGRCLTRFHVDSPVGTALLLPRTNRVITWSHDNTVRIWDAEGGLVSEIPGVALPIALASGGHELSAVTPEHEPVRISLDTGKRLFRGVPIRCDEFLCFSAGLESIYTLRDGTRIQRWSATTGRNESSFRDLGIKITALVPTAANDRVVVGMENGEVVVYLVGSGINVATLRGHTAAVRAIACGREARYWITGSDDCSLRLWNLQEERCAAVLQGHASPIRAVCVFPNISLVASSGLDVSARLWGLEWDFSVFG